MELPVAFTDYTRALMGAEEYNGLAESLEGKQPVSIRLNEDKLAGSSFSLFHAPCRSVPWSDTGFYLPDRLTFTFDPLFHAGCYYVQEASSMFVEQVLKQYPPDEPAVMLDLCAAPGGKSTHVRSLLPEGSLLVANEVIRSRSRILAENLTKWGHTGVLVTHNDPADFSSLKEFFDVILTDVPCSGEGMFRKDPVAVSGWSPGNVEICRQRQRRILSDVWPSLKPGGLLVYSTCTYNTKENEENVRWMQDKFGAEPLPLHVRESWHLTGNLLPGGDFPVYRFLPHKTEGEGFFLAVLRKPGLSSVHKPREKRMKITGPPKEQLSAIREWLLMPDHYEFILNGNSVSAFPRCHLSALPALQASLRIVQAGVAVAELKGKDRLPDHALAMSLSLNPEAFSCEKIGYEQAVSYLRKEAVTLADTAPRGVILLLYKDIPLGFVKNVGNRANNLYPQEWRIRSGFLPAEVKTL